MMISNAYGSNPYTSIQNTNQLQTIQPAGDTAQSDRLNKKEDMAAQIEQPAQPASPLAAKQAFEVNITPEAMQQSLAAQAPATAQPPQTTEYGYGQMGTQNTRQAVEAGRIINLTG